LEDGSFFTTNLNLKSKMVDGGFLTRVQAVIVVVIVVVFVRTDCPPMFADKDRWFL
jgi:hypothetical protein